MEPELLAMLTESEQEIVKIWQLGTGQGTDDIMLLARSLAEARREVQRWQRGDYDHRIYVAMAEQRDTAIADLRRCMEALDDMLRGLHWHDRNRRTVCPSCEDAKALLARLHKKLGCTCKAPAYQPCDSKCRFPYTDQSYNELLDKEGHHAMTTPDRLKQLLTELEAPDARLILETGQTKYGAYVQDVTDFLRAKLRAAMEMEKAGGDWLGDYSPSSDARGRFAAALAAWRQEGE